MEHKSRTPHERLLFSLGLCAKAGKLICGTPMITESLRGRKRPYGVLSASDNSPATQKKLRDKCSFYGVELIETEITGETLSRAVGKSGHLAAVAVTDENLFRLVQSSREELKEQT